jgi:hypothetical protein
VVDFGAVTVNTDVTVDVTEVGGTATVFEDLTTSGFVTATATETPLQSITGDAGATATTATDTGDTVVATDTATATISDDTSSTGDTTSGPFVIVTVTSTLTALNPTATVLVPLTLQDIFPACANLTSSISALSNITIPDMVLPSRLTLGQVFNFTGSSVDCGILGTLLGGDPAGGLRKRMWREHRRLRRLKRRF